MKTVHKGLTQEYRAWTDDEEPDTEKIVARVVCDLDNESDMTATQQVYYFMMNEFFHGSDVTGDDILDEPECAYSTK